MIATVRNFGDSVGVQFPRSLLNNVKISENDDVEIVVKYNSIIIKRRESHKHLTTKERIVAFGNTMDELQFSEIDWGKPQGKEIW
ncbi:MAG: hypothetical protein FWH18_02395 [Marinilabiliaceae bacterium]|nr:hypothetical protein [Marinilabiliaceae bacterium]